MVDSNGTIRRSSSTVLNIVPLLFVLFYYVRSGWDEGVMQMSLGEKSILHISSDYGYGESGAGGVIPPNADLDFEVELLAIGDKKAPEEASCCIIL